MCSWVQNSEWRGSGSRVCPVPLPSSGFRRCGNPTASGPRRACGTPLFAARAGCLRAKSLRGTARASPAARCGPQGGGRVSSPNQVLWGACRSATASRRRASFRGPGACSQRRPGPSPGVMGAHANNPSPRVGTASLITGPPSACRAKDTSEASKGRVACVAPFPGSQDTAGGSAHQDHSQSTFVHLAALSNLHSKQVGFGSGAAGQSRASWEARAQRGVPMVPAGARPQRPHREGHPAPADGYGGMVERAAEPGGCQGGDPRPQGRRGGRGAARTRNGTWRDLATHFLDQMRSLRLTFAGQGRAGGEGVECSGGGLPNQARECRGMHMTGFSNCQAFISAAAWPKPRPSLHRSCSARCSAWSRTCGSCWSKTRSSRLPPAGPRQGLVGRPRRSRMLPCDARRLADSRAPPESACAEPRDAPEAQLGGQRRGPAPCAGRGGCGRRPPDAAAARFFGIPQDGSRQERPTGCAQVRCSPRLVKGAVGVRELPETHTTFQ